MRRLAATVLAVSVVAATLACAPGAAAEPATAQYATVELGGVVVLRIRSAAGWESVWARADEVYRRLHTAIDAQGDALSPDVAQAVRVGGQWTLQIAGHLIATVDEATAKANGMTPQHLAQQWAANLKAAIERYVAVNSPSRPPVF